MNVLSMAPITATQFGANFGYNSLHHSLTGRSKMTEGERLATAFAAGATSALIANPTELVVIRQQQNGRSLGTEVRDILSRLGARAMAVGVTATMAREGIYGCCWMEVRATRRLSFCVRCHHGSRGHLWMLLDGFARVHVVCHEATRTGGMVWVTTKARHPSRLGQHSEFQQSYKRT